MVGGVTVAGASWGLVEAEGDHQAEAPSVLLVVPHQVSEADTEEAEEAVNSLTLNTG